MRVGISGSSGLIGTELRRQLEAAGHVAVPLVRHTASAHEVRWDPAHQAASPAHLVGIDAIVNLAGAGIGDHRWTDEYRKELVDSRLVTTTSLAEACGALSDGPRILLSGSAVGFYGDRHDEELDETSAAGAGFLADLCERWEAATAPAEAAGVRVAHLRTGIVLSPAGGALRKQLPLFKLGLGGRFGNGRQYQSWISIDDEVGAIMHLLGAEVSGAVNLTAPNPVTNTEFSRLLGKQLHRPAILPIPSFGPKLLLGGELAEALLFTGQRVLPRVLEASGYTFRQATLEQALAALLPR